MKKRIIVSLILILFFATGCSAEYNLVIEDDVITETTHFNQESNDRYTKNYAYELYTYEYPIFYDEEFLYYNPTEKKEGNTYYDKDITDNNGLYNATYTAKYNISNYNNSQLLNNAYKNFSIGYERSSKTYYIIANNLKIFKEMEYLDSLKVSIDLKDYEVLESNQQSKNGNVYIWNFDRNSTGTINLKFAKKDVSNENKETEPKRSTIKSNDYTMYIFAGILLIVMLTAYFIFNNLKNKNDEMDD